MPVGVVTQAIMERVRILSKDWIDDAFTVTMQKSVMLVKTRINLIDLYEKGTANKWTERLNTQIARRWRRLNI